MPITELRAFQREALPTLEWLFNPNIRQTGKSFAMALAIVRTACKFPGTRIDIIDHVPVNLMRDLVRTYIEDLARSDLRLSGHFTTTQRSLTINLPQPLDWWPPDFGIDTGRDTSMAPQPPKAKNLKTKRQASKWKHLGKI